MSDDIILNNLFRIMRARGVDQKQLAYAIGVSPQVISDWKSGRNRSFPRYLPQIASILGVPINAFYEVPPDYIPNNYMYNNSAPVYYNRSAIMERVNRLPDDKLVRLMGYLDALDEE